MPPELAKCPNCGKLFAAVPGKDLCVTCTAQRLEQTERIEEAIMRWNLETPEEIASFVGMTVDEVKKIIKETSLFHSKVDRRVPCQRCRKKPAQPDSDYCLDCRLELNRALGIAVGDLTAKIEKMTYSMRVTGNPSRTKAATTLDDMGKRIGRSRGDFAPKNRYRA